MKRLKLDENFPPGFVEIFKKENIDASSVLEQQISGSSDEGLYQLCIEEKRTIVTFDLDFASIVRFPADTTSGIIVCRLKKNTTIADIKILCKTLVSLINSNDLDGKLFIVEHHRIRIRKPLE